MKYFIVFPMLVLAFYSFSQRRPETDSIKTTCPVCKSDKNTIPVIYGRPTTATVQRADKGEIRLGGCIVSADSPGHFCKKDQKLYK